VSCEISVSGESSPSEIAMTPHRDPARHFEAADANWDLLGGGRPEAASRMTGGLGWSRGARNATENATRSSSLSGLN